jgi:hypothetical protein
MNQTNRLLMTAVGALLCAGCYTAGPVSASARTVTQPVQVGEVRQIGGARKSDWGKSRGEIDVDVVNSQDKMYSVKTGSEYFGVQLLKQARTCPRCPIQLHGIEVSSKAGGAGVNRILIEGEIRPAGGKGGAK